MLVASSSVNRVLNRKTTRDNSLLYLSQITLIEIHRSVKTVAMITWTSQCDFVSVVVRRKLNFASGLKKIRVSWSANMIALVEKILTEEEIAWKLYEQAAEYIVSQSVPHFRFILFKLDLEIRDLSLFSTFQRFFRRNVEHGYKNICP